MPANFNAPMHLESDIIEKRLSSSARESTGVPSSSDTRPCQRTRLIFKVDNGTGITQDITLPTKKPVTSTALIRANVASIDNNLDADRTPELDPKIGRLWALYQTGRVEYSSCPKGSFAQSKAARFLRDTIENGLVYIERAYPSVICDSNSETFQGSNLSAVRNKLIELRASLKEITPVVEKAYGGQKRRFCSEVFQPMARATEDKQRVSLHRPDRDVNTDRVSETYHDGHRTPVSRVNEANPETVREPRRSRTPSCPRALTRPRIRSRSRSPMSSRFPPRMRSPLSSPGLYENGHAANRNIRKFRLDPSSWRGGPTARFSFPRAKDRYRPTY